MDDIKDLESETLLVLSKLKERVDKLQTKVICYDLSEKDLRAINASADMADNILFMDLLDLDIEI